MTSSETALYNKYLARLELVTTMMADKRTNKQIIAAVNKTYTDVDLKSEDDFLAWISGMNESNRKYLKKWATELKNAGKKVDEIALTIGHTSNFVNLLLNTTQQAALDSVTRTSTVLATNKRRASTLANQEKTVAQIATALGVTAAYVTDTLLGADYLKKWARRLADDDTAVTAIASKIGKNSTWVKGEGLGATYMKKWAKKLADKNMSVSDIAKKLDVTATDVRNYLGTAYLNSWAHRLMDSNTAMGTIATKLGESGADKVTNYLTTDERKAWAKRLADTGNYTVTQIATHLSHTEAYTRDTLLGKDYMISWVQSLHAQKKDKPTIRSTTGLTDSVIDSYIKIETDAAKRLNDITSAISKATSTTKSTNASIMLKNKISSLANSGNTIATIASNADVTKLYGKKPTNAEIQSLMGTEFMKAWAKKRIYAKNLKTVASDLGYTDPKTIWNFLTSNGGDLSFIKEFVVYLADNDHAISQISTYINVTNTATVRGYFTKTYLQEWAKGIAEEGGGTTNSVSTIASALSCSVDDVRDTYLGSAYLIKWLKRIISKKPSKNAEWINSFLSTPSKEAKTWIHNSLKGTTDYKNWAANLKNLKYTVAEIRSAINQTECDGVYIRDTLLGKAVMRDWVLTIIKKYGASAADVTAATSIGVSDKLDILRVICDVNANEGIVNKADNLKEMRSWAIRLTNYTDSSDKTDPYLTVTEILKRMGVFYELDSKKNKVWKSSATPSTQMKSNFHSFIEYEYSVEWVKRLNNSKLYTTAQIKTKTGLSADTVTKYINTKL